jgi:hypothetical protein
MFYLDYLSPTLGSTLRCQSVNIDFRLETGSGGVGDNAIRLS